MRDIEEESFDQLCSRLAYNMMNGIARGESAIRMAHGLAGSTLMLRRDQDERDSRKKAAIKKEAKK